MYLDWEYFLNKSRQILSGLKVRTTKQTSGTSKGQYTSRVDLDYSGEGGEDFLDYKRSIFGCADVILYTRSSRPTKEDSYDDLVRDVAHSLLKCDYRERKQLISDKYDYYKENKGKEKGQEIGFDGVVGRENIDLFRIIDGEINEENWRTSQLKTTYSTDLRAVTNFKEFYYAVKKQASEKWLQKNRDYMLEKGYGAKALDTFIFNIEKVENAAGFDIDKDFKQEVVEIPKTNATDYTMSYDLASIPNMGFTKVGFNEGFLNNTNVLIGRERNIIFPSNEKHRSYFAIVELSEIKASHNEITFGNTVGYPVDETGRNVNDRNYSGDENAKAKVISVAQNLDPDIIVSTSATASGTPIISIDGIVVSGNNRTMSLKLAKHSFEDSYEDYKRVLFEEISAGGYGFKPTLATQLFSGEKIKVSGGFYDSKYIQFTAPVLVRIDVDFKGYTMEELNKYNQSRSKTERQIDQSIRLSNQLKGNEGCKNSLIQLVSEQETVSDLYNDKAAVTRYKKILLDCGLITENQIAQLFTQTSLTDVGKSMYETILLSLILDAKALEISQNDGIKSLTKGIVNAIIPLVKNNSFKEGSIIPYISDALYIQNDLVNNGYSSINQYLKEQTLFGEEDNYKNLKPIVLNILINQGVKFFKNLVIKYNSALESNLGASMFGDNLSPDEIFNQIFIKEIGNDTLSLINKYENNVSLQSEVVDTVEVVEESEEKLLVKSRIEKLIKAKKYLEDTTEVDNQIKSLEKTLKYL
jgi:hypothetical protein